ncbi:MAG TPA: alpha/beta family hydrolase [Terriglobia bacterium]|jgi:alpha/beta superfamily hydrolase|nr:alpha/beta family hydrolase [Terriglobia bacterium]
MTQTHSTRIERLFIEGPSGRIEALLEWIPEVQPPLAAVVCHPHPLYGGTMHTKAVFRAAKAALSLGLPALRFNFRGAGHSEGVFAQGVGERDDARAALDFLSGRFPGLPLAMMGFSFGSVVGLAVGAADRRVAALVGLGVPIASHDMSFLLPVAKPKLIVQGSEDIYGPRDRMTEFFNALVVPKQIRWVEGADHFFTGRLDEEQRAVRDFLDQLLHGLIPSSVEVEPVSILPGQPPAQ